MCGVCGVVSTNGEPPDLDLLTTMIGHLGHRGPDGSGYYRDQRVALGHTRLAIIDTAGGAQPMSNEDGTLWVTFNGEIFNYVELREELHRRGHRFRTSSDTEVIVHAWQEWGEACFERFNGQWALALWDNVNHRLVLSRDRLGVRPLYYAEVPGGVLFASEVKSILAHPAVDRGFDPVGLNQTFSYWSTVAPRTAFRGVSQLQPGHYALIDATGIHTTAYWQPTFPAAGDSSSPDLATSAAELREHLVEATRLRFLRSDVPVGAYLSGGLDSAITATIIARYTDTPLHTFSLRFDDAEFDEGGYQELMSAALGTQHKEVIVGPDDVVDIFPEVIRHTETPIVRAGPAPMFLLSKLVSDNGYKVVVTGEGADEVLAGYDIFREARVRMFWARNPESRSRARALELLYPWMERSPSRAPAFAQSFFGRDLDITDPGLSHRPRWNATAAITQLAAPEMAEAMTHSSPYDDVLHRLPAESAGWDPLARAQWLEMSTLLSGYVLSSQGDRMLMANSVEGRFPFLDRDVVGFANTLPAHHKLFGLDEKHLLKRAFADVIPPEILRRPKQPYRAPDAASFFGGRGSDWFDEVTSPEALAAAGVFEPALVTRLLEKCARTGGRRMSNTDNMRVLAVVSTQLVHHDFVASTTWASRPATIPPPTVAIDLVSDVSER